MATSGPKGGLEALEQPAGYSDRRHKPCLQLLHRLMAWTQQATQCNDAAGAIIECGGLTCISLDLPCLRICLH